MPDDTIPDDDILAALADAPADETETPAAAATPEPTDEPAAPDAGDAADAPVVEPGAPGAADGNAPAAAPAAAAPATEPAPAAVHEPAVALQTLAVDDPDADAWREYQAKAGELRQKLKGGTYDAIEDASKSAELNLLHQDLMNRQLHRQQEQVKAERFWSNETQQHGLPRPTLEKLWTDTWSAYAKKYPNHDPQSYHLAAVEAYQQRVAGARATKPKAAAAPAAAPATPAAKPPTTPPPPVNKGGARITTPGSNANRPPAPKPKDAGEEFDKAYGPSVGALLN